MPASSRLFLASVSVLLIRPNAAFNLVTRCRLSDRRRSLVLGAAAAASTAAARVAVADDIAPKITKMDAFQLKASDGLGSS
eukprot:6000716-Prymnesium_polylepis.1